MPLYSQEKGKEYAYSKIAYALYTKKQITINGILSEWDSIPLIYFAGFSPENNKALVKLMWDMENLYVAFKVSDSQLNAKQLENNSEVWEDDCVELYISTNQMAIADNLSEHEFQILANVNGCLATAKGKAVDKLEKSQISIRDFKWKGNVMVGVVRTGTVNNNLDEDIGYNVEMAIKWSSLKYEPKLHDTLFSDLVIEDLDSSNFSYFDWAHLSLFSQPNKWNQIVLVNGSSKANVKKASERSSHFIKYFFDYLFIIASFLVLIFSSYLIFKYGKKEKVKSIILPEHLESEKEIIYSETHQKKITNKALGIILEEYANDLTTEIVADRLCISPRNFRRVFKQETQKTFGEVLNETRVKEASRLLKESDLQISEISFQIGFQTYVHFRRVFIAHLNCTPSEYRKKFRA